MTKLEIQDLKGQLTKANKVIFETADAEKRSLTAEESSTVTDNLQRLDTLDLQLRNASFEESKDGKPISKIYNTPKKAEKFSLIKAINDRVESRNMDPVARDVFTLGKQEMRNAGLTPAGDIVIPLEVRADILAGTPTAGQEIVAEEKVKILPPLSAKLIFTEMGCQYLPGLVGNVSIPTYAGTTVAWKTEVAAATDGGGAFAEVNLSPLRITAFLDVSKTFLAQDAVGAEQLLYDNIVGACARLIESTVLGVAIGVAGTQPGSFGYTLAAANANTEAAIVPTYATLVAMEANVDASNALEGNLAYVTNPAGRAILKSHDKGVANDTGDMLCSENNMVNGYKLYTTTSCSGAAGTAGTDELLIFGNWGDLIIGQWGGYDITVDPYSQAINNQVKIVVNTYVDVKGARGTSGAGADIIEYAVSWDVDAIKMA